ncbi:helix-turn-helix domain-containing protein [Desemzia incerta]|uniref:helix-turn-helix domain-containing protein n=1 Tax=Desemzia incerta TaxID=82801 RepID=UPI003CFDC182
MGIVDRIKELCEEHHTTFAEVERRIGLSNGQIRRWDKASPKFENVEKVADYFGVTVEYLRGKEVEQPLPKNLDLDEILDNTMSFDGQPMTDSDREAIRAYLIGRFSNK